MPVGYRMIKWLPFTIILSIGLMLALVNADEISTIELSDGSIISGEVVSFDGNTWIIKSGSMGTLKIDSAKVVSIRSKTTTDQGAAGGLSSGNTVSTPDLQALQQEIMANEQIMAMIMNLQDDPEIQAILQDPEIMNAVNAGDMNALLANPKFIKLMENAKIKRITKEAVKE